MKVENGIPKQQEWKVLMPPGRPGRKTRKEALKSYADMINLYYRPS